jgi:hypothetical protein
VNLMANMAAHTLAKFAVNVFIYRIWVDKPSSCICDIIER